MRVLLLGVMVAVAALMPASTRADDQQIADFIKARLMQEKQQGNLFGFNVDMRVDRGTVWFKGFVSNRSQELMILRTAQLAGHLGVVQVVDDIDVNSPMNQVAQQPQPPQARMMPQERVAMRPQQPPRGPQYQVPPQQQNMMQMQPRQPAQMPSQAYPQPQMQRQPVQRPMGPGTRMPQTTAPHAPQRMQMPLSAKEPKKDSTTKPVAYQEPIGQSRIPASPLNSVVSPNPATTQPSFQQSLLNSTPAQRTSAPINPTSMAAPPSPAVAAGPPLAFARAATQGCMDGCATGGGGGYPMAGGGGYGGGGTGIVSDSAELPGYAWPAYAAHPNYGAVSYPKQYSASAWPYIGPFYPYPQVPLGWRKVALEWDDGWWYLDFHDKN